MKENEFEKCAMPLHKFVIPIGIIWQAALAKSAAHDRFNHVPKEIEKELEEDEA